MIPTPTTNRLMKMVDDQVLTQDVFSTCLRFICNSNAYLRQTLPAAGHDSGDGLTLAMMTSMGWDDVDVRCEGGMVDSMCRVAVSGRWTDRQADRRFCYGLACTAVPWTCHKHGPPIVWAPASHAAFVQNGQAQRAALTLLCEPHMVHHAADATNARAASSDVQQNTCEPLQPHHRPMAHCPPLPCEPPGS